MRPAALASSVHLASTTAEIAGIASPSSAYEAEQQHQMTCDLPATQEDACSCRVRRGPSRKTPSWAQPTSAYRITVC